ncbi:phosphoglycerol transferase MdoB-like AlkP superfamily enzyme [Arcticibacter pallidicorallinus]|uniref:Phosphoglycerol transferase MdoB-like AlkP superfamily enzyme n=1 Tax=Arcticibacter pallidicorallinus TaxID=1259464 RepID=A0A2T0U337_9SPHI|nr:alkaline phosphatase family protein [Arcticibacter pallidicorallinus]PRY52325.1 phosphoglycerol transferase MdoB-like AlkP superfamily enzyme [Arcticibacter pallidicorallinus]
MNKRFEHFYTSVYKLFCVYLFQLLLFTCFRISFIVRLHNSDIFCMPADTARAFVRGFQFDTMVISYGLIVPFILYLTLLISSSDRYRIFLEKFVWAFCGLVISLFLLILFIDQYFYNYFQSHINILIFGLIDDDTKAVMTSVWSDYPILKIFLLWGAVLSLYAIFVNKLFKRGRFRLKVPVWVSITGSVAMLIIFVLAIRQSVSTFPLQPHDTAVSPSQAINFLTTNGVYALKTAFSERGKAENLEHAALDVVKELGYNNAAEAARDYFQGGDIPARLSDEAALGKLFSITPVSAFLEQNPPNIVFVFMESMSNYNMTFDSDKADLMGRLKPHFRSDIVFRNFVSSGNTTVQSLEFLITNSPVSLTQSRYRFKPLPTGTALPFKKSGYETTFITGGETNWRNIHELAPNQGFDKLLGKHDIYSEMANAQGNHWGAYDEHLFEYAFKRLSATNKAPQFMFIQTTTNHTPFDLPASYKPGKIELSADIKNRLLVDESLAIKNLNALQYSNNCLGAFLDKIKHSSLAKNTIVVATGDHNNLMLFDFDESSQADQRGVPLYVYVPERYQPDGSMDTSRFGSHKDIFPTLYHLALSDAKYFSIGNNLLEKGNQKLFFGMNLGSFTAFSAEAAAGYGSGGTLYKTENKRLKKDDNCSAARQLMKQARANYALSVFAIINSLKEPGEKPHIKKRNKKTLKTVRTDRRKGLQNQTSRPG